MAEVSQKCVLPVVLERQLSHRPVNEVFFVCVFLSFLSLSFFFWIPLFDVLLSLESH